MAEEEINLEDAGGPGAPSESPLVAFIKKNRSIIISVSVVALILGIIVMTMSSGDDKKKRSSGSSDSIMVSQKELEKPKKKRKKIKYVKLFNQLEAGDVSKILKQLSMEEIVFKTEQIGQKYSIFVDEEQTDEARNLLAIKGLPAGKAKIGYELLDDAQTLGVTEFDKRIRFLRALSGEIEKAITQIQIIESAKVQIVLPEQRLFTVTQPPVTASIIIRIMHGKEITDEVVYSIIQLVANAVENLQQENISVVDTDGNLLSDGVFERIAAKRAGIALEEETPPIEAAISREAAIGTPIIPNYERIQEWFEIKWQFEQQLKEKTERQLFGILPIGSFKVEVTSDLGPLENGNIVDIKRQTISVVIDGLNEDIYIDQAFKQQVFSTIAGAVGYLRGRDTIQLSVAEFALYTEEEKKELQRKYAQKGLFSYLWMTALGVGIMAFLFWVVKQVRLRLKQRREEKEIELKDDLEDLGQGSGIVSTEDKINQIKTVSDQSPDTLAAVMESWIKEDATDDIADDIQEDAAEGDLVAEGEELQEEGQEESTGEEAEEEVPV